MNPKLTEPKTGIDTLTSVRRPISMPFPRIFNPMPSSPTFTPVSALIPRFTPIGPIVAVAKFALSSSFASIPLSSSNFAPAFASRTEALTCKMQIIRDKKSFKYQIYLLLAKYYVITTKQLFPKRYVKQFYFLGIYF